MLKGRYYRYLSFTDGGAAKRDKETGPRSHSWNQHMPQVMLLTMLKAPPKLVANTVWSRLLSLPLWGTVGPEISRWRGDRKYQAIGHLRVHSRWPACWIPHQEICPWSPRDRSYTPSSLQIGNYLWKYQIFSVSRVVVLRAHMWQAAAC